MPKRLTLTLTLTLNANLTRTLADVPSEGRGAEEARERGDAHARADRRRVGRHEGAPLGGQ